MINKIPATRLLLLSISVFAAVIAMLLLISPSRAHASYNGGNLIDSAVFLDANAMSRAEIQSFLSARGSGIATRSYNLNCYGPDSKERQWYTAVGAPCDTTVPASHIIYYAAQIYGINPRVILATLQKEQSLITTANPTSWQISQAMGYACPTSGNCNSESNFFYQIDSGTWVLRYHYERANGNLNWWNPSTSWTCGTEKNFYKPNLYPRQNVNFFDGNGVLYRTHFIQNPSTSSMYCYTPHAYNNPAGLYGREPFGTVGQYYSGSYNFVYWFEIWFGPTTYGVVRAIADNGNITQYVIYDGKKQGIPSNDVLFAWNLDQLPLEVYPQSTIDEIQNHSGNLSRYVNYAGVDYLADDGTYYKANDPLVSNVYGFPSSPSSVTASLLNSITNGGGLSAYVSPKSNATVSIVNGFEELFTFGTTNALRAWHDGEKVISLSDSFYNRFTNAGNITHNRVDTGVKEFIVDNGKKIRIFDEYETLYPFSGDSLSVSTPLMHLMSTAEPLTRFVRSDQSGAVFTLNNGIAYGLPSQEIFSAYVGQGDSRKTILGSHSFELIPVGNIIRTTLVRNGINYYALQSDGAYPIPSNLLTTYSADASWMGLDQAHIDDMVVTSNNATRFVTSSSTAAVFFLADGNKYGISNPATKRQLMAAGETVTQITYNDLLSYSYVKNISNYVSNGTLRYVVDSGEIIQTDVDTAQDWGLGDSQLTTFSQNTIDQFINNGRTLSNYTSINGTDYVVSNAKYYRTNADYSTLWGFPGSPTTLSSDSLFRVANSGSLSRFAANGGVIFTVDNGSLVGLTSLDALFNLGYSNQAIVDLSDNLYSDLGVLSEKVRRPYFRNSSGDCIVVDQGSLRTPQATFISDWCPDLASVPELSDTYLSFFSQGSNLTSSIRAAGDNTIFAVDNGNKRWIPSNTIYNNYFSPFSTTSKHLRNLLPNGPAINPDGS